MTISCYEDFDCVGTIANLDFRCCFGCCLYCVLPCVRQSYALNVSSLDVQLAGIHTSENSVWIIQEKELGIT